MNTQVVKVARIVLAIPAQNRRGDLGLFSRFYFKTQFARLLDKGQIKLMLVKNPPIFYNPCVYTHQKVGVL